MMDKKSLQKKLNQPYSTENWREVVQFVFPNVQILNPPMVIPIDNDKVEQFRQLGNVQLHDGKTLALFELKLKENVNIIRNRVELNNIVSRYIDQDQTHGVLSIFEKGGDDYRFTFSASASEFDEEEGDFVTKKTDTKRFTYVLGKNESCKTPAQRFYELSENKNKAEIKDIENAFSVEKLSKAFFKEYKDQYSAFVNFMMQTPGIFKTIYNGDDKAIRDFVKLLLGRIIFIKFVQKKGWMGVDAASKKWENGDFRFLENSFTNFKHQDLFYSRFLEPLFETLNTPNRPNDIFAVTNTRVPYLSGGLFELEDKKTKNINFPAKYFNDLFEFLDRYNFTIDENDSNDHEVGIDPEMLGHIFENLLEDNKDKGAFYTPKEIVRYMCQESLKEYLKTSLENNNQWPTDEKEAKNFEQALHNFVTKKEAGGIIEFEETIARALKEVKICDPAIGSGAFPMGLLNEIFQLVHKLHEANKDKVERVWELKGWQPNLVKQNIIQNSIYGVDIEKGAVDVARLRFWLSLIVDEPEPKALPHLDYKIVVGNSLVSKLDDTIIDIDWEVKEKVANLFGNENEERQQLLLKEISAKQKLVFDPNSDEEKLSLEIRNLKIDLLVNQLDAMVKTKGVHDKPKGTGKNLKAQTELWLQTLGWKQQIEKLQKLKKNPNETLHFFDWKLDFPEIMNDQVTDKVGFDIVIGNPPYINFENLPNDNDRKSYEKFETYTLKGDIYYLFCEAAFRLLKKNGLKTYIISNKWLRANSGLPLRKFLSNDFIKINQIFDFNQYMIFENAIVHSNIIIWKKSNKDNNSKAFQANNDFSMNKTLSYYFENFSVPFVNYSEDIWNILNEEQYKIKEKIEKKFSRFSKLETKISYGIKTGFNEAFIINEETKEALIKQDKTNANIIEKIVRGRDTRRYHCNPSNLYMIISRYEGSKNIIENYPSIFNYLKQFEKQLKERGQVRNGQHHWLELDNNPKQEYFDNFKNPKIIFSEIVSSPQFYYDESGLFPEATTFFIQGENLKIILALLNSKCCTYFFKIFYAGGSLVGKYRYKKSFLLNLPIPIENAKKLSSKIITLVDKLQNDYKNLDLDNELDNLVYKLYELTYDEVLVVEPEFAERMSREEYEGLKVE